MHDFYPEPDPEQIRIRLRGHMGVHKISRSRLSMASGISRGSLTTKLDGPVEFTVPEITAVAHALGKDWLWVMTGANPDRGPEGEPAEPSTGLNTGPIRELSDISSPFGRLTNLGDYLHGLGETA